MPPEDTTQEPTTEAVPEAPKAPPSLSTIRTFQGDATRTIKGEKISLAGMAIKERERQLRREPDQEEVQEERRNKLLLLGSALVILIGIGLVSYFAFFRFSPSEISNGATPRISLIFSNSESEIDTTTTTQDALIRQIREKLSTTNIPLGNIQDLVFFVRDIPTGAPPETEPTKRELTVREFFNKAVLEAPDAVVRQLANSYMYGIHSFDKNFGFLFLRTANQEKVYSELLSWEKLNMARSFIPLLREEGSTSLSDETAFQDALIKNIDTRVLRDDTGKIVFIYGFLNPTTLIVAGSDETFIEVLQRFTQPRPRIQ